MHEVFSTFIYHDQINFDLVDLKKECHQIWVADKKGQIWSKTNYVGGYTSYSSWDQLHRLSSNIGELELAIRKHVIKYAKKLNYSFSPKQVIPSSLWVNIMPSGAQHTAHIHPNSVISGTFYVDVPPNSSAIKFEDPRMGFFMNTPPLLNPDTINGRFFNVKPKAGDIVLFESWLRHEVPLNRSKKPRISISFNYNL